ncbi:mycofactocin system FadH/OYE family oxidoreductase 2 [Geotalea uraniireducens]|uniref:NADH:flavin oxidoreductase/NADH oxidase n=1 Tax=Geotalea uraniireducens (strain Rf4) TaxID=351605 RepID=A5G7E5_GEOUR|nr:mycofactocin system FadH/OYE family oxidoreductase 2 [Geotalea uraniireducens]ABQ27713.1 NADH:flavin oxidoreductase/NADH oxidase [Geotalea uraniireducens Rf4]
MMFPNLFSPLKLGTTEVKNRISFQPHLTNLAIGNLPSERQMYYWGERAKGGAGLIITEELTVHPTDMAYEKLIDVYHAEVIPGFKKITDYVHQYDAKIFAQLNHNGQQGDGSISRLPVWAPSPIPDVLFRETPKAMEPEDIEEVARYFAKSAIHVREGGFDGIELQFGHSSLARQFLSPLTNFRNDEYGGSLENRMRAPLKFIAAVRKAVGNDFTLGIRMCADEMIPGGLDLAQVQEICARFEASGLIDFMDLSIATFYNLYLVEGSMHTPLGYTIPLAAGIRERIKLPVFCTGRINDPVMAEKVLANGQADMIGMCRGLICDPFLPKKAQEGRLEDIRYCIACNQGCIGRIGMNKTLGCVQNPAVGREKEWGEGTLEKASVKKNVTIVGGGPAGMWAAKMAGRRGHKVTLIDRNEGLGGQVVTAMKGTGRDEFGVIIRNEKSQVDKAGVTVKLGAEATTEQLLAEKPDVVIVATGSIPKKHPVGGADGPAIFNVLQVLNGEAELGQNVCLIDYDGHQRATATAEFLANQGKKIDMITSSLFICAELGPTQDLYSSRQRLLQKGVTFTPDIAVMEVGGEAGAKTVKGFNVYSNVWFDWGPYDSIVLVMGQQVEEDLYMSLKGKVPELYRIGDCVAPRKVDMAIWEGHKIGREI